MNNQSITTTVESFFQSLLQQNSATELLGLLLFASFASLLIAMISAWLLPQEYRKNKIYYMWLIWGMGTFIPLLGAFFAFSLLLLLLLFGKKQSDIAIRHVISPSYSLDEEFNIHNVGEGSARTQIHASHASQSARTESLLSLNFLNNSAANKVIQYSMKDSDDQIRLLAFSLINNKETRLHDAIYNDESLLVKTRDKMKRADIHQRLAFAYWETIYLNLAQDELYQAAISKAKEHTEQALKEVPNHAELWVLLGKIHLKNKKYDQAIACFQQAKNLNILANTYLPYLAELFFLQKNFGKIRGILHNKPLLKFIPTIGPVVDYWCAHEEH